MREMIEGVEVLFDPYYPANQAPRWLPIGHGGWICRDREQFLAWKRRTAECK